MAVLNNRIADLELKTSAQSNDILLLQLNENTDSKGVAIDCAAHEYCAASDQVSVQTTSLCSLKQQESAQKSGK
jgi:hypothetical protein